MEEHLIDNNNHKKATILLDGVVVTPQQLQEKCADKKVQIREISPGEYKSFPRIQG